MGGVIEDVMVWGCFRVTRAIEKHSATQKSPWTKAPTKPKSILGTSQSFKVVRDTPLGCWSLEWPNTYTEHHWKGHACTNRRSGLESFFGMKWGFKSRLPQEPAAYRQFVFLSEGAHSYVFLKTRIRSRKRLVSSKWECFFFDVF